MKVELKKELTLPDVKEGDLIVLENGLSRLVVKDGVQGGFTVVNIEKGTIALLTKDTIEEVLEGYPIAHIIPSERLVLKEI